MTSEKEHSYPQIVLILDVVAASIDRDDIFADLQRRVRPTYADRDYLRKPGEHFAGPLRLHGHRRGRPTIGTRGSRR